MYSLTHLTALTTISLALTSLATTTTAVTHSLHSLVPLSISQLLPLMLLSPSVSLSHSYKSALDPISSQWMMSLTHLLHLNATVGSTIHALHSLTTLDGCSTRPLQVATLLMHVLLFPLTALASLGDAMGHPLDSLHSLRPHFVTWHVCYWQYPCVTMCGIYPCVGGPGSGSTPD
jgi:hypothetical protein